MFCPQCGQERVSQATSFCSRCGFLLTAAAELLETGGVPPSSSPPARGGVAAASADGVVGVGRDSPRSRGIKMGLFMLLLTFVIAPLVGILSVMGLGIRPWPTGIVIFLLGGGGLLRIAYAMMFESKYGSTLSAAAADEQQLAGQGPKGELYPSSFISPTSARSGGWLDTNDLEPTSVTDHTTKLLEKDKELTD